MWPSWVTVAIVQVLVLAAVAVPSIFLEDQSERIAFVLVAGVLLTVVVVVLYTTMLPAPLAEMSAALEDLVTPLSDVHVRLSATDPTTTNDPWTTSDPFGDAVLATLDSTESIAAMLENPALVANAKHTDIFQIQCRVRDAVRTLALQQKALARLSHASAGRDATPASGGGTHHEEDDLASCLSYRTADGPRPPSTTDNAPEAAGLAPAPAPAPQAYLPRFGRGDRFMYDKPSIAMYIERNKNGNLVIFEARSVPLGAGSVLPEKDPIDSYWLDIDPTIMARHRREGRTNDRHELSGLEKRFAYGITCKRADSSTDPRERRFTIKFVALDSVSFELRMITGVMGVSAGPEAPTRYPAMVTSIDGQEAVAERIYVKAHETSWLPKVEYVDLFGRRLDTGEDVTQRFVNK
jgi:hypothetical protein